MREQLESTPQSHSGYMTQSNEARKERMDKKRAIRKNKIQSTFCEHQYEQKQKITKQQKVHLQKAKNREAAQRSRDQHKKYVESLQQQIRQLKEQLSKPRYCLRCSKDLALQTSDSSDNSPLDLQMENPIQSEIQIQNNQEFQEFYNNDSSFIRVNEYDESSPLKMFLFIAMIALGIFLAGDSFIGDSSASTSTLVIGLPTQNARQLMELDTSSKKLINEEEPKMQNQKENLLSIQHSSDDNIFQNMKKVDLMNHISNSFNSNNNGQMTSIVPLTYELSPLNQVNCLKSLIQQKYVIKTQPQFYSFYEQADKNERHISSQNQNHELDVFKSGSYGKQQNNMLFCTLPKIYRKNQNKNKQTGLFSKIIDIIVSGSQMMQIVGQLDPSDPTGSNLWMNKVVNFNGLYKINAQIKGIVQISDQNCVL